MDVILDPGGERNIGERDRGPVRLLRGCLMKSGVTQNPTHEYFVVEFDGLVQSGHRRFVDAVRVGLQLKDHFPQHNSSRRLAQSSLAGGDAARHERG
jgi:hypothetical protein